VLPKRKAAAEDRHPRAASTSCSPCRDADRHYFVAERRLEPAAIYAGASTFVEGYGGQESPRST
jgi:hypothetical protein